MTCTKTEPKNDLFLNCRRKTKELSKKELSNVAPASENNTCSIIWIQFQKQSLRLEDLPLREKMQKCKSGVNLKKMLRQTKKTEWNRER